ncbi:MAG: hypothetical protein KGL90_12085 [Burkholderiales bacterium]|nr:hypothetical protein [Burkholderiales bacterium]
MASALPATRAFGWKPYRRFRELILVSVAGHLAVAAFYGVYCGQVLIALAFGGPALLVLGLFPLAKSNVPKRQIRAISHLVLLVNLGGLLLGLMWTGLSASTTVWWLVWWPLFVAHLIGVLDGLVWVMLALLASVVLWSNDQHHWVQPLMNRQDNPLQLLQVGFLLIGAAFGLVVRRAHDVYEATIKQQKRTLEDRATRLENALQALQQANLDRTRMFAQISHEVRTPLNGLMGFAQLLGHSTLTPQQARHVDQIRHCGDTLLQIVNEMLDFSRLEATSTEPDRQPFDAIQLASCAVDMVASIADQKGVTLVRDFPIETLGAVGDPLRIKQILLNLLGNALKFTASGEVHVRCCSQPMSDGRAGLYFEVQDSGIGIPHDAMPQLFQPFSKASDNTIQQYGGSGLGLAICKRLVDMMSGSIGVHSEPGRGTLFWFEVPLSPAV